MNKNKMEEQNIQEVCDKCCEEVSINYSYVGEVFQWLIDNNYKIVKEEI